MSSASTIDPTDALNGLAGTSLLKRMLVLSVLVHGVVLSVRWMPEALKLPEAPTLEVILVNAESQTPPEKPDALAQAALDGGGDQAQGRAKSPLPASAQSRDGDALSKAQARLQQLEALQQTQTQKLKEGAVPKPNAAAVPKEDPASNALSARAEPRQAPISTADLLDSARELARMEAQVSKQIDDYNRRPKKHFFSPSTSPYEYALYEEAWRQKVERFGNLNYPDEAKGKLYGQLRMTVYIRADGSLQDVEVDSPSGVPVLDRAAIRIVRQAAPYAKFPPAMAAQVDVFAITRTWIFTNDSIMAKAK